MCFEKYAKENLCDLLNSFHPLLSPKMGRASPKLGGLSPKSGGLSPKLGGLSPKLGGVSPKLGEDSPKLGKASPKSKEEFLKTLLAERRKNRILV